MLLFVGGDLTGGLERRRAACPNVLWGSQRGRAAGLGLDIEGFSSLRVAGNAPQRTAAVKILVVRIVSRAQYFWI